MVFLYLPIQDAPQSVIMFHINQSIDKFQQQNESLMEQVERLENTVHHRDQQIAKLEAAAVKQDEVRFYFMHKFDEICSRNILFSLN